MNIYKLSYDKVIERWTDVALYASKNSDSFSLITEQVKPYQEEPPKSRHDELLAPISGEMLQQEVNAVASNLLTKLYYQHVSDDGMTLVIGDLLTFTGTALIIIIAVCLIIARAVKKRKKVKQQQAL